MIVSFTRVEASAKPLRPDRRASDNSRVSDNAKVDAPPAPTLTAIDSRLPSRIHLWRGASGQRHLCTVYSLLDCPQLMASVCLLVRREADGRRTLVDVRVVDTEHSSLNLAEVRHSGATLGANEVHVSFLPASAQQRDHLVRDLAGTGANPMRMHA